MAVDFLLTPGAGTFKPSGQPLLFTAEYTGTPTAAFRIIFWVYEDGGLIGKYYVSVNADNTATLDLGRVILNRCKVDETGYGAGLGPIHAYTALPFTLTTYNIRKYEVKVGEYTGTESAVLDTATAYLFAGYEQTSAGLHPSFADYYGTASTKKFWLTDREATGSYIEMTAADEDEGVIACLISDDVFSGDSIMYAVTNTSNVTTTTTITINATNGAQLPSASSTNGFMMYAALMPVNVEAITGVSLTNWKSYTIQPVTAGTLTIRGKAIRVTRNCNGNRNDSVLVAFSNTRGGWDYLRFFNNSSRVIRTEEKTYKRNLIDYNAYIPESWLTYEAESLPYQKTAKQTFTLNGIFDVAEAKLLPVLMRARQVMGKIDGVWVPLNITDNQASYQVRTSSKLTQASINVELAQSIQC
jgi:hypothetical protein